MWGRQSSGRWLLVVLVLVVEAGAVDIRGPHHPRSNVVAHTHHRPDRDTKITSDQKLLRDAKHIEEDLQSQGAAYLDTSKMTPEEMEFYYFKMHDYDNNTKLDGLEILQAINHALLQHPGLEHKPDGDFEYFVDLIDRVLADDDANGDGYLSYPEYVVGRGRELAKKANNQPTSEKQPKDVPAVA